RYGEIWILRERVERCLVAARQKFDFGCQPLWRRQGAQKASHAFPRSPYAKGRTAATRVLTFLRANTGLRFGSKENSMQVFASEQRAIGNHAPCATSEHSRNRASNCTNAVITPCFRAWPGLSRP